MHSAGHFGGDYGVRLTAQMSVPPIFGDVALKLVTEAVGLLHDGHLAGHPERPSQSGVSIFGQLCLTAECTGLDGCEIHTAELQELPVMRKAAQVASLGEDSQRIDWPDPRNRCQQPIVVVGLE